MFRARLLVTLGLALVVGLFHHPTTTAKQATVSVRGQTLSRAGKPRDKLLDQIVTTDVPLKKVLE